MQKTWERVPPTVQHYQIHDIYMMPSGEWNCVKAAVHYLLISSYGQTQTYHVASLCSGPVGRILYNIYFKSNLCGMSCVI